MITIVDYGMGNLSSVANAIKRYTKDVRISTRPKDVTGASKLVLPGVGAFKMACQEIEKRGLRRSILEFIESGKPFLGICLGLQLLFDKGFEDGEHQGFGVIKGEVVAFPKTEGLKVPHMGWNRIVQKSEIKNKNCPLLKNVPDKAYMYFVHSYYAVCEEDEVIATTTNYGKTFCSMVWKDNIYAMQFHPEKSQTCGLKIIENFVSI